ncbi:hypothetical protein [Erythrobacter sp. F6033]|uniref:hypothetical protein n=1 Tax=Erythrobacter sp. F6033 TaxID=2926401 RepID=UPI001FF397CC|nr:hypothetical protein [Erythrobacter sp. F6033]MCK0129501.1 hypothetical protein [Erythrobacter sp. F6033]
MIITLAPQELEWIDPLVNFLAVLLGASLAWGTTYFFAQKARNENDLAVAYSLVFKVNELCERIYRLDRHISNCVPKNDDGGFEKPAWPRILDVIGFSRPPEAITSNELALVARTKDNELTMAIKELESGHKIAFECFNRIIEYKGVLAESGFATKADGDVVSFEATQEQYAKLAPTFIGLESGGDGLVEMLPGIRKSSQKIAQSLGPKLKEHFGFKHFVAISFPNEDN